MEPLTFDSQKEKDDAIEAREDELEELEKDILTAVKEITSHANELEAQKQSLKRMQAIRTRKETRLKSVREAEIELIPKDKEEDK
jgi:gamma-glutamyl phosphate reductase